MQKEHANGERGKTSKKLKAPPKSAGRLEKERVEQCRLRTKTEGAGAGRSGEICLRAEGRKNIPALRRV